MSSSPPPPDPADADLRQAMLATASAIRVKQSRTDRDLRDLREQLHRQNQALSSVNALLTATLDATPLGVMACNRRGEVVRSNRRLEAMFPWPAGPAPAGGPIGVAERLGPGLVAPQALQSWLADVLAEPQRSHALQAAAPDGRLLACEAVPQWVDDDCVGVVLNWLDVTEQYDRARLLAEAEAARGASAAQSAFLSRASHELRTPLNAVLGFSHLLSTHAAVRADAKATRQVSLIQTAGRHLAALVDDLLQVSKLETGELHLRDERVDLASSLQEVADLMAPIAAGQHINLSVDVPAGAAARGDRSRVRQVLLNLVGNAVKYNRPGGSVAMVAEPAAAAWSVQIRDTGAGLSAEQQAHLFEPFNRLEAEHQAVEGTGLGLFISRRLMQAMQGSITVHSEVGVGSTFTLSLPLDGAPTAAQG